MEAVSGSMGNCESLCYLSVGICSRFLPDKILSYRGTGHCEKSYVSVYIHYVKKEVLER